MATDEQYMHRCLQLAELGAGNVAPNPMVGAVLVYDGVIIGEGYHQKYGESHAEVNCIADAERRQTASGGLTPPEVISRSTLYVSLEPCAHFGKTPPCADLIIKYKIPKVIIGCRDPFKEVNGKGIEKLKAAGIEVEVGILEEQCKELNKRFFVFHTGKRPYIILKWAETADGFIAPPPPKGGIMSLVDAQNPFGPKDAKAPPLEGFGEASLAGGGRTRLLISNEYTNRLVHKWRSEEAAILVGTNTIENDDPELTTRLWPGNSPVRFIVDMKLRLASSLKVFNKAAITIIFNTKKHSEEFGFPAPSPLEQLSKAKVGTDGRGVRSFYYQVTEDVSLVHQIVNALYQLKIQSVIVEGGAKLLQSFIEEGMWDEARVIRNGQLAIGKGLPAPKLNNVLKTGQQTVLSDTIEIYTH